jgi:hypothetical protein
MGAQGLVRGKKTWAMDTENIKHGRRLICLRLRTALLTPFVTMTCSFAALRTRSKRPSAQARRQLIRSVDNRREVSWAEIQRSARLTRVSRRTVARSFRAEGIPVGRRRPREKPLRDKVHLKMRLEICTRWSCYPAAYWTAGVDMPSPYRHFTTGMLRRLLLRAGMVLCSMSASMCLPRRPKATSRRPCAAVAIQRVGLGRGTAAADIHEFDSGMPAIRPFSSARHVPPEPTRGAEVRHEPNEPTRPTGGRARPVGVGGRVGGRTNAWGVWAGGRAGLSG